MGTGEYGEVGNGKWSRDRGGGGGWPCCCCVVIFNFYYYCKRRGMRVAEEGGANSNKRIKLNNATRSQDPLGSTVDLDLDQRR
jgi:hypothetical protein